jgi:hypothetical protein
MGTPAKKKATQDERKPRIDSFAAFVCAQPFDIPPREIVRAAVSAGYEVKSTSAVQAYRKNYPHLRFVAGDHPTTFVMEFLASKASRKAKNYTSANSSVEFDRTVDDVKFMQNILKGTVAPVTEVKKATPFIDISAIVDSVLHRDDDDDDTDEDDETPFRQALKSDPIDHDALWGRRADGTPRKKSGPKYMDSVSIREQNAGSRQTIIDVAGETVVPTPPAPTPPAAQVAQARVEAEGRAELDRKFTTAPKPVTIVTPPPVEPTAAQTEEDARLQKLRNAFDLGDFVQVKLPSPSGNVMFIQEGRIVAKEPTYAAVDLGKHKDPARVPYQDLQLAPRKGTANANGRFGNGRFVAAPQAAGSRPIGSGPLKAVPPAFTKLRAVESVPEPEKRKTQEIARKEPEPKPVEPPKPVESPAPDPVAPDPVVAKSEPEPVTSAPVVAAPIAPPATPSLPSDPAALDQAMKDLITWVEMGKPFFHLLPVYQARLRTEAEQAEAKVNQLKQEIERLLAGRAASMKQADDLGGLITLMKTLGGET